LPKAKNTINKVGAYYDAPIPPRSKWLLMNIEYRQMAGNATGRRAV